MKILSIKQVLILHELALKKYGGTSGIRDISMLESAINRPFATFDSEDLYPDMFYKLGALVQSIVKNHPFIDGNKRTGFVTAFTLLKENNFRLFATESEVVIFMVSVANDNLTVDEIAKWLKMHTETV